MQKLFYIILIIAGGLIFIVGLFFFILKKTLRFDLPKPVSDVKIVYKIGWWAYQEALNVKELETKVITALNLFNQKVLVEYSVSGVLTYRKGWKPFIKTVCISERWMSSSQNSPGFRGDIQIVPVVGVKKNDAYNGEKVPFSVKVQDYLHSGGWGKNLYCITSQKKRIQLNFSSGNRFSFSGKTLFGFIRHRLKIK